jgi:hypothetical protein
VVLRCKQRGAGHVGAAGGLCRSERGPADSGSSGAAGGNLSAAVRHHAVSGMRQPQEAQRPLRAPPRQGPLRARGRRALQGLYVAAPGLGHRARLVRKTACGSPAPDSASVSEQAACDSSAPDSAQCQQVGAFGAPGRDPRGWTVTVAYAALVPSSKLGVKAAVSTSNQLFGLSWRQDQKADREAQLFCMPVAKAS